MAAIPHPDTLVLKPRWIFNSRDELEQYWERYPVTGPTEYAGPEADCPFHDYAKP